MAEASNQSLETRLQAVEDQLAIQQLICGYGYAMDGCNEEAVASLFSENAVYAVGDIGNYVGSERIGAITRDANHLPLVAKGCAHVSTLPYVVLNGDRAAATCHTMVVLNEEPNGFTIFRISASRIELSRKPAGGWQIDHRQNHLLDGNRAGPDLLARLTALPAKEVPAASGLSL